MKDEGEAYGKSQGGEEEKQLYNNKRDKKYWWKRALNENLPSGKGWKKSWKLRSERKTPLQTNEIN